MIFGCWRQRLLEILHRHPLLNDLCVNHRSGSLDHTCFSCSSPNQFCHCWRDYAERDNEKVWGHMSLICADFNHEQFMVLISGNVNKKSVSMLMNFEYLRAAALSISPRVFSLSSYFPCRPVKAHMSMLRARVLQSCLRGWWSPGLLFKSALCGSRYARHVFGPEHLSSPRAAGSITPCPDLPWSAPYALALLPLSTDRRHPADRMQNCLCSVSPPHPLPLTCLASFLNPVLQ